MSINKMQSKQINELAEKMGMKCKIDSYMSGDGEIIATASFYNSDSDDENPISSEMLEKITGGDKVALADLINLAKPSSEESTSESASSEESEPENGSSEDPEASEEETEENAEEASEEASEEEDPDASEEASEEEDPDAEEEVSDEDEESEEEIVTGRPGFIYKYEGPLNSPENCKIYVGYSQDTFVRRKGKHVASATKYIAEGKNGRQYLYNAMGEYGIENFKMSIIEKVSEDQLDEREIHWIKELNTMHPNGYNNQSGGDHAAHNQETREYLSQAAKSARSKDWDLPMYVNYFDYHRKDGSRRHGFRVCYVPSGKQRYITVPIDKEVTYKMRDRALKALETLKYNHANGIIEKSMGNKSEISRELGLPVGVNYFKANYNGKPAHGFRGIHPKTKSQKFLVVPISEPFPIHYRELAIEWLDKTTRDYEITQANLAQRLAKAKISKK